MAALVLTTSAPAVMATLCAGTAPQLDESCVNAIECVPGDRKLTVANPLAGTTATDKKVEEEWRKGTVEERLSHALGKGMDAYIDADTEEVKLVRVRLGDRVRVVLPRTHQPF